MNFRLKTSRYVAEKLKQLQTVTNETPNIIARHAIAISVKQKDLPNIENIDTGGVEFNRHTLTGGDDEIFRAMIAQHLNSEITDEEYFPSLFNAHLERGVRLLAGEYQHSGNIDRYWISLLKQCK
ncbi:DndE family protein [Halalkalibacter urbisdiaboli]|uniref:DndE family protein n=1 Tax=Halalkalibacter urbisdiaboli TaxID=1960589 RepID=UPI000B4334E0|nr:DndE family protein [Halalkalibacter urbisdiaboli]